MNSTKKCNGLMNNRKNKLNSKISWQNKYYQMHTFVVKKLQTSSPSGLKVATTMARYYHVKLISLSW